MWSGAPQWNAWSFPPQNFQNLQHDQVDWAALAKQWIQMKETKDEVHSAVHIPLNVPPVVPINDAAATLPPPSVPPLPPGEEGPSDITEMDMEIEDDKDPVATPTTNGIAHPNATWSDTFAEGRPSTNNPNWPQQNWGWGWSGDSSSGKGAEKVAPPPGPFVRSDFPPVAGPPATQGGQQGGLWPPAADHAQTPVGYERRERKGVAPESATKAGDFQLDAAQKKKLPSWIREGLEKMEKEKMKKLEKERQMGQKELMLKKKREQEERARQLLEEDIANDGKPHIPKKSKFESASDDSEEDAPSPAADTAKTEPVAVHRRKSRFAPVDAVKAAPAVESGAEGIVGVREDGDAQSPEPVKSQEERMEEMLVKLRRWMTEILLDVTTKLIEEVASEVINRARMKAPAVQMKRSSALSSLSGGYGLNSESETDGSGDEQNQSDSDEELRQTIHRKKREFASTEREILHRLQVQEETSSHVDDGEASGKEEDEESKDNNIAGTELGREEKTPTQDATSEADEDSSEQPSKEDSSDSSDDSDDSEKTSSEEERHRGKKGSRKEKRAKHHSRDYKLHKKYRTSSDSDCVRDSSDSPKISSGKRLKSSRDRKDRHSCTKSGRDSKNHRRKHSCSKERRHHREPSEDERHKKRGRSQSKGRSRKRHRHYNDSSDENVTSYRKRHRYSRSSSRSALRSLSGDSSRSRGYRSYKDRHRSRSRSGSRDSERHTRSKRRHHRRSSS